MTAVHGFMIRDLSQFVPYAPTLSLAAVLATNSRDPADADRIREYKQRVKAANRAHAGRPCTLNWFSQGNGQSRLYYMLGDVRSFQADPLTGPFEQARRRLLGSVFEQRKDYSDRGGPSGLLSARTLQYEAALPGKDRRHGDLIIRFSDGETVEIPEFGQSRQVHWTGFAFEEALVKAWPSKNATLVGTSGVDLQITDLEIADVGSADLADLEASVAAGCSSAQLNRLATGVNLGKQDLIRAILLRLGCPFEDSDISRGGTVTRSSLRKAAKALRLPSTLPQRTKAELVQSLQRHVDQVPDDDDTSRGGTITASALSKILYGIGRQRWTT